MQSLSHMCHVTNCQNFEDAGFYVKYYVISHKYNNCCSLRLIQNPCSRARACAHTHTHTHTHTHSGGLVFFIKAGGKYNDCPLKGCHCVCEACTEKVHGRLKTMLTETMEKLFPLLMILQNRTLLSGCRYIYSHW